jgi:DNA-directed RNA polymerase specialized sigma24 family protein
MAITADPAGATDAVTRAFTNLVSAAAPSGTVGNLVADAATLRPQLLAATREVAVASLRRAGTAQGEASRSETAEDEGPGRVTDAFRRLPERWRSVLWLVEVERIPPAEAARIIGVPHEDIAALTQKAWRGLAEECIGAGPTASAEASPPCSTQGQLVAYFSGNLATAQRTEIRAHLGTCASCAEYQDQLETVGSTLRQVVVPLPEGLLAAATAAAPPVTPPRLRGSTKVGRPLVRAWLGALGLAIIGVAVLDQSSTPLLPATPRVLAIPTQYSPALILPSDAANTGARQITPSQQPVVATTHQDPATTNFQTPTTNQPTQQTSAGTPSSGQTGATPPSGGAGPAPGGTSDAPVLALPPSTTPQLVAVNTGLLGIPVVLDVGACSGLQLGPIVLGCTSP